MAEHLAHAKIAGIFKPVTSWKSDAIFSYGKRHHVSTIETVLVRGIDLNLLLDAPPTIYMQKVAKTQVRHLYTMKLEKWIRKLLGEVYYNYSSTNNKLKSRSRAFINAGIDPPINNLQQSSEFAAAETSRKIDSMVSSLIDIKKNTVVTNSIAFRVATGAMREWLDKAKTLSGLLRKEVCIYGQPIRASNKYIHDDDGAYYSYKTFLGQVYYCSTVFAELTASEFYELAKLEGDVVRQDGQRIYVINNMTPRAEESEPSTSQALNPYKTPEDFEMKEPLYKATEASSDESEDEFITESDSSGEEEQFVLPPTTGINSSSYLVTNYLNKKGVKILADLYPYQYDPHQLLFDEYLYDLPGSLRTPEGIGALVIAYTHRYVNWRMHLTGYIELLFSRLKKLQTMLNPACTHEDLLIIVGEITKENRNTVNTTVLSEMQSYFDNLMREEITGYLKVAKPPKVLQHRVYRFFHKNYLGRWKLRYTSDEKPYGPNDQGRAHMKQAFLMYTRRERFFPLAGTLSYMFDREEIEAMFQCLEDFMAQ